MLEGKLSFREIFDGDKTFEIPRYQRAYTWEEKHLSDFLEDLKNQPNDKKYFFGSFLFHEAGEENGFAKSFIVDGQQRLTTAYLFIKIMLERLKECGSNKRQIDIIYRRYIGEDDISKLSTSNNDNSFFDSYIMGTNKPQDYETNAQKRLYDAKKFFLKHLGELQEDELNNLLNKMENASVLVHTVTDKSDAAQIFELINDRGKRLTDLEAIKSFLMYKISISTDKPKQLLRYIENNFAKIYRITEKLENNILEDQLLTYYVIWGYRVDSSGHKM